MGPARPRTVVVDCDEPHALAEFWSRLLGAPVASSEPAWAELAPVTGFGRIAFQRVRRHRRPGGRVPQQLHLDLEVEDLPAAAERAVTLGATRKGDPHRGEGGAWQVFTDPAGHPFCLVAASSA